MEFTIMRINHKETKSTKAHKEKEYKKLNSNHFLESLRVLIS